jgi:hypothetical protein
MNFEKVKSIVSWPMSICMFDVRNFHGLENFYQKFIINFSRICAPLTKCMKKEMFQWKKTLANSFETLMKKATK